MSLAIFPLSPKFEKPTRWLLPISLADVENALGGIPTHLTVLRPIKQDDVCPFLRARKKTLLVCVQGDCQVGNISDDELCVSGNPDCEEHFYGCVIPANGSYEFVGLSLLPAVILLFSQEPLPAIPPRFCRNELDFARLAKDLRSPVTWVYVNSMARNGYPAGNHWHAHKHEMLYPLVGHFRIGSIPLDSDNLVECELADAPPFCEPKFIYPHHAHAVKNIAPHTSRLLVLATGEPRDHDDFPYDVYPSPL